MTRDYSPWETISIPSNTRPKTARMSPALADFWNNATRAEIVAVRRKALLSRRASAIGRCQFRGGTPVGKIQESGKYPGRPYFACKNPVWPGACYPGEAKITRRIGKNLAEVCTPPMKVGKRGLYVPADVRRQYNKYRPAPQEMNPSYVAYDYNYAPAPALVAPPSPMDMQQDLHYRPLQGGKRQRVV